MSAQLSKLVQTFESLWPLSGAEDWDRPGLTLGDNNTEINKVLLSVDVTLEVLKEAKDLGCNLLVSHHPLLLQGVNFLAEDQLKGELVAFAIRNSIALYSAHTNADIVQDGVSEVLAKALGLKELAALVPIAGPIGHGRVGNLAKPMTLGEFADLVADVLPETKAPIRIAGHLDSIVRKVALVGGAGDSFIRQAKDSQADVFLTSDLRHHVTSDAWASPGKQMGLIDVSHFAAESLWLAPTAKALAGIEQEVEFIVSKIVTDPWVLTVLGRSSK